MQRDRQGRTPQGVRPAGLRPTITNRPTDTMKNLSLSTKASSLIAAALLFLISHWGAYAQCSTNYYMRNSEPWGSTQTISALNDVFGPANYNVVTYSADPNTVFSNNTCFVYMEGSNANGIALNNYLAANISLIESWVTSGGRLFINAAVNDGASINAGFGGTSIVYGPSLSPTGTAVNANDPVFLGPYLPVGTSYTGNYFSHNHITGSGLAVLMVGTAAQGTNILSRKFWGNGVVFFGGITNPQFWSPSTNSFNLWKNIFSFVNSINTTLVVNPLSSLVNCRGAYLTVPYTSTGTVNAGNVFTVQLSNAAGSFASPVNIGSVSSTVSGFIDAFIPSNTPVGNGYRVRVVSSSPSNVSESNGQNLTIEDCPPYRAEFMEMNVGSDHWCQGEIRTVSVTVRNTGTATWTNSGPDVNIGATWSNNVTYPWRVNANDLAPGQSQTYDLTVTAPATPGAYTLQFDVVKETDCWFGNNNGSCGPGNAVYTSADQTVLAGTGATAVWYLDADNDGHHVSTAYGCGNVSPGPGYNQISTIAGDCNDSDPTVFQNCGSLLPGSLLKDGDDEATLAGWLSANACSKGELLYRKSQHGGNSTTLRAMVANQGPTVLLVKTTAGRVFGAYRSTSYPTGSPSYSSDPNAFLISFSDNVRTTSQIYPQYANYDDTFYGPTFGGGHDLYINNTLTGGYTNFGHSYNCPVGAYGSSACRDYLAGSYSSWTIADLEIYKVTINAACVNTGAVAAGPFCDATNISVPYTASGTFNGGNVFTAQLSDANGNFANAVNIGTVTATASGTISATIPSGLPSGMGYRIRVVSSSPANIGNASAAQTVNHQPPAVPTVSASPATVCNGAAATLTASGLAPGGQVAVYNGGAIPFNAALVPGAQTNYTVEFWVKPNGTITAAPTLVESNAASGVYPNFPNGLTFATFPNYGGGDGNTCSGITIAGMGVAVGTNGVAVVEHAACYAPALLVYHGALSGWTHVAVVYTNNRPTLYLNGAYVKQGLQSPYNSVPTVGTSDLWGGGFNGSMDNLRVWSTSRTQTQLINNMYRETPNNSTGLVAHYPLNGNYNAVVGANLANNASSYAAQDFYTYTWSGGPSLPTASTAETQTTGALTTQGNHAYTVVASVGGVCPSPASAAANVTVNAPTASFNLSNADFCPPATGATVPLSGSASGVNYQLYRTIFKDDFETFTGWSAYGTGVVAQSSAVAQQGTYSLHKTTNGDPNGGVKAIGQTVGNVFMFEGWLIHQSGTSANRLSLFDGSGNGYGFRLTGTGISIERRAAGIGTVISSTIGWTRTTGVWYRFVFLGNGNGTYTLNVYDSAGVLQASVTSNTDNTYSALTQVVVQGGTDYHIDDIRLSIPQGNAVAGTGNALSFPDIPVGEYVAYGTSVGGCGSPMSGVAEVSGCNFITQWNLATAGSGADQISFGVGTTGTVNYTWQEVSPGNASGSGTFSGATATISGLPPGSVIRLRIHSPNFNRFIINNGADRNRLVDVVQWGDVAWANMQNAFYGCNNLGITATDVPILSAVSDMGQMFRACHALNGPANIGTWNTSGVNTMEGMFYDAWAFDRNISTWNTSSVTNMRDMFRNAETFDQPIGSWTTSAATNMASMFKGAIVFNQNLNSWTTAAVNDMNAMFEDADAFNGNITGWNTAAVTNMSYMFYGAGAFNQNIGGWTTSSVTNMTGMFRAATAFDQNIGSWNTAAVTSMAQMFLDAGLFDQNISGWNTAAVTDMTSMFASANAFNQPIGNWNTANVTSMANMFADATAFDQNLGNWILNSSVLLTTMLNNSGLDCANYSATLSGWANPSYPTGRNLGASGRQYTLMGQTARTYLTSFKGWTITGDAFVNDVWYLDADNDGYYTATQTACSSPGAGWTSTLPTGGSGDCDDNNAAINPGAADDNCNGIDENCSGEADEDYSPAGCVICSGGTLVNTASTWYLDADADGWYTSTQSACNSPGTGWTSTLPAGGSGDCDDSDNTVWQLLSGYVDNDGDGYTVGAQQQVCSGAALPSGYAATSLGTDCNDNDAAAYPGAPCNDGSLCTTNDALDANCNCVGGAPLNCDDGDPSTTDSCDPLTGCIHTPMATAGHWTGLSNTLWDNPGNWADANVPGTGDEAIIPTTPIGGNMPTVNIANAAAGDITIQTGAILTISTGNALTVDGVLTNNGTVNVQNAGSLVQTSTSTLDPTATGSFNVTRTGSSVYDFWSSPITTAPTSVLGGTVYQYNPVDGTNGTGDDAFDPAWGNPGGTLAVGRGYAAYGAGPRTFTGTVNNGSVPKAVEYHDYTVSGMPFNLIGNPYPSGISATDFINANSALVDDGVVYLWDDPFTGTYTGGDYATRNLSGGTAGGVPGNIPGPVIGSHQGFKIRATADGTVNFTNAMRTATNPAMLFRQADDSEGLQRLWLSATSETMRYNQTMVAFGPDGSEGRDWGFDAPKLNATGPLRFYSMLDEEPMAIQTYGMLGLSTRTVPLGLHTNASVMVTIAIDSVEGLQGRDIVLEDRYYGLFHDLRQADYTFRAAEGAHHGRLFLRIGEGEATGIAEQESGMMAYIADGFLHLRTTHAMTGNIELMDMGGRMVLARSQVNMGPEVLRLDVSHLARGVYAVRLSDHTSNHTAKVIH